MSRDNSKALVSDYIEAVWNNADSAAFDELTLGTYTYRLGGQPPRNRAAMQQFLEAVHKGFPDWRVEIRPLVGEGDTVVAHNQGILLTFGVSSRHIERRESDTV